MWHRDFSLKNTPLTIPGKGFCKKSLLEMSIGLAKRTYFCMCSLLSWSCWCVTEREPCSGKWAHFYASSSRYTFLISDLYNIDFKHTRKKLILPLVGHNKNITRFFERFYTPRRDQHWPGNLKSCWFVNSLVSRIILIKTLFDFQKPPCPLTKESAIDLRNLGTKPKRPQLKRGTGWEK